MMMMIKEYHPPCLFGTVSRAPGSVIMTTRFNGLTVKGTASQWFLLSGAALEMWLNPSNTEDTERTLDGEYSL